MDDNEATKLEPYKFSITPNSQTCSKLQYNITIVSNCDTCTKTNGICNDNNLCNCNEGYQIDPNLIKYEIFYTRASQNSWKSLIEKAQLFVS